MVCESMAIYRMLLLQADMGGNSDEVTCATHMHVLVMKCNVTRLTA